MSCTFGPLVNKLSRYFTQKKKKNQIREKVETDFCIGTSTPAGVWVQDFNLFRLTLSFTLFYMNTLVLTRWVLGEGGTFCLHMLFLCPPCWEANSEFSSGLPRVKWDEVLHHTDKNADWGAATGEERRPSVACEVWISSGKVSMINPLLGSRSGAGFFAPRWAAVSLLCSQARWMDSNMPRCWIYLLHYSLRVLAFTLLQFCVHAGGGVWSLFLAFAPDIHDSSVCSHEWIKEQPELF